MSASAPLSPVWLRPIALCSIGLVHGALVMALPAAPPVGVTERVIELAIVAPPEEPQARVVASVVEPPAEPAPVPDPPQAAPVSVVEPAVEVPPLPEVQVPEILPEHTPEPPAPTIAAPAEMQKPVIESRDAMPVEKPAPEPPPNRATVLPTAKPPPLAAPRPKREQVAVRPPKPERIQPAAAAPPRPAASSSPAAASSAGYSARVRGILQARANALVIEDADGSVGITFTIAANGRLANHSISRPSGNFQIDRAIRSMLASISFPPPPGGQYSGSVTVRVR